jgi:thiosulfate reductase cytochrome b subunit
MIASGLQVYRAYPRFGERGGPYYPQPFHDVVFPEWARLGGWLAGGINWHFFLMWPLMLVGLVYVGYLVVPRLARTTTATNSVRRYGITACT